MDKIKLGIVGFGFMGHCDADMMETFDEIELVAVADTNPEQLKDLCVHRRTAGKCGRQCAYDIYAQSKPSGNGEESSGGGQTCDLRKTGFNECCRI